MIDAPGFFAGQDRQLPRDVGYQAGLAVVAVLALLTAVAVCFPSAALAVFPGANARIALDDGDADVVSINANGSGWTGLAHGTSPAWSPDGMRIAYQSCGGPPDYPCGIFVMNADGSGQRMIPNTLGLRYAAWSPSGHRLVAAREGCSDACGLYVFTSDGSALNYLSSATAWEAPEPVWSPTGGKIAYGGFDSVLGQGGYLINTDGTANRRLSSGENPDWSPDGQKLVFDDRGSIVVMNGDGSGRTPIASGDFPAWSPDGQQIFFRSFPATGPQFVLIHPDGSAPTPINTRDSGLAPDWQALPIVISDGLDRDKDGYSTAVDCDDGNATIHPGAYDLPGDGIDQDCSGADAQPAQPPSSTAPGPATPAPVTVVVGSAQAPQSPALSTVGPPEATLVLSSESLRALRRGRLKVRAVCSETCRIALRVVTRRGRVIARCSMRARAGRFAKARFRLTRGGKRVLRRVSSIRLVLRGTVADVAGNRRVLLRTVIALK